jgi:glycosyltransferase involved in cell wall biosynthesis
MDLHVIHLADSERQRTALGEVDVALHKYSYEVLFHGALERVGRLRKLIALARALRSREFDVVVISGYSDIAYWAALVIARLRGSKVIVAVDSTKFDHARVRLKEWVKALFLKRCNAAFGYGTRSLEYCRSLGLREDQVFIRCQATDGETITAEFEKARSQRDALIAELGIAKHNVIYVGRLSEEKDIGTALRAFKAAVCLGGASDWGFLIVGDGPSRPELSKLVDDVGVPNVNFLGGRGWREVPAVLALADILVLPSRSEPWGLVVNEAMECWLPVLVSEACGSAPDLVEPAENGYRFSPGDVAELSARMHELMTDGQKRARMGEASKRIIRSSTPAVAAQQMISGIRFVLGTRG